MHLFVNESSRTERFAVGVGAATCRSVGHHAANRAAVHPGGLPHSISAAFTAFIEPHGDLRRSNNPHTRLLSGNIPGEKARTPAEPAADSTLIAALFSSG